MPLSQQEYKLIDHLSQYVSDHRKELVEQVLNDRTRQVTVVLEDIYQAQNASAAIRTCECMGLQDIHIIENINKYQLNIKVLLGSYKWENLIRYKSVDTNNTEKCFADLRDAGYTICATDPAKENISVADIDVTKSKIALVFGNELNGLSEYALKHADLKVKIPMYGFTESLNVSASVAVCLTNLIPKIKASENHFGLSQDEKDTLRLSWYRKMVKRSEIIEKQFLRTNS